MKNERKIKVEFTYCTHCNAIVEIGHDDDSQQHCAWCGHTFIAKEIETLDKENFDKLVNGYTMRTRSGWTAYRKIN